MVWHAPAPAPDPVARPLAVPVAARARPHPDWDIGASRVVGALALAQVASRLQEGEARDALAKGAEQLLEAGLAE